MGATGTLGGIWGGWGVRRACGIAKTRKSPMEDGGATRVRGYAIRDE